MRIWFAKAVALLLLISPSSTNAQLASKVHRVGFIQTVSADELPHPFLALKEGLRELGYVEGRNVVFESRFADGNPERLFALAREVVRSKVDVIVTGSNPVIGAVKQATATVPVVMAVSRDPVGSGFVATLARPGGNITGLSNDPGTAILGKQLELLKQAAPAISRVGYLWNPVSPGASAYRDAAEGAARKLGMGWQSFEVRDPTELDGVFAAMTRAQANAVLVAQDPLLLSARNQVTLLATTHLLPAMYANREFAEVGGLMSYGTDIIHQFRRAAAYVDKILKGAKPGDLAVEQPTKFELVINMTAARAVGLVIPASLRLRADLVIE